MSAGSGITATVKRFAVSPRGGRALRASLRSLARWVSAAALRFAAPFAILSVAEVATVTAQNDREAMLKAAIVFKLTRYVTWPEEAFAAEPDSLRICLTGDPAMLEAMAGVQGREVEGRRIDVLSVASAEDVTACNMLYIGEGLADRVDELTDALGERSVVSVSEIPSFASGTGMIELVRRDRRFGFRINLVNARSSGIEVSAQLLDLADVIDPDAGDGAPGSGRR